MFDLIFKSSSFWIGVSFVLFFVFFGKKLWAPIAHTLDHRADEVEKDLAEVKRLREEAEKKLQEANRLRDEAEVEARNIVAQSRVQAKEMAENAREETRKALQFYEETAKNRIASAESLALEEIKHRAVDLAIESAGDLIPSLMNDEKQESTINDALRHMPKNKNAGRVA